MSTDRVRSHLRLVHNTTHPAGPRASRRDNTLRRAQIQADRLHALEEELVRATARADAAHAHQQRLQAALHAARANAQHTAPRDGAA